MGPQSLPVEFNWPFGGWGRCSYPQGGTRLSARRRPAHFPRGERHDRFSGRLKPPGKVAPALVAGVLQTREVLAVWGTEESHLPRPLLCAGLRASVASSTWVDC